MRNRLKLFFAASRLTSFLILLWVISGGQSLASESDKTGKSVTDRSKAYMRNQAIGRGINFGNALEAPNEGEWGMTIKESYVQAIADSGFNSVRLPICWSAHTSKTPPHSIDPVFLSRVDEVIGWCLDRNLAVIITIHHFNELYDYPENTLYLNIFFSIWKQLTEHYLAKDHERLIFEVLNEPHGNLTAGKWNQLIPKIIDSISILDADRTLIIDAPDYATHTSLSQLIIPETEDNIIVSTRYYLPWQFAQQGAWWSDWTDLSLYLGTTWRATESQKNTVTADVTAIKSWSAQYDRPVTIGEWGSIMFADNQSRLTWTNYVRRQFEVRELSWSYFDFGVVFKAYSIAENRWLPGFAEALTGNSETVSDGRVSYSLRICPLSPAETDEIDVMAYISIPNRCTQTDSSRITKDGSVIKVKTWHTEQIPQVNAISRCADTLTIGRLTSGTYTLIFDSDYLDIVNPIHYSVIDTLEFQVSSATSSDDQTFGAVTVYPVPASNCIRINNIDPRYNYQIYDLKGCLRTAGNLANGEIIAAGLSSGGYTLRVLDGKDVILRRKIIIVR